MAEKAEVSIGGGATIKGDIVPEGATPAIATGGGASIAGDVTAGGGVTGRDDTRYTSGAVGNQVTFSSQDNAILMNAIITMGKDLSTWINAVDVKLDDLPKRVASLERARLEVEFKPVPLALPLPIVYPPAWMFILLFVLAVLVVGGVAFTLGGRWG